MQNGPYFGAQRRVIIPTPTDQRRREQLRETYARAYQILAEHVFLDHCRNRVREAYHKAQEEDVRDPQQLPHSFVREETTDKRTTYVFPEVRDLDHFPTQQELEQLLQKICVDQKMVWDDQTGSGVEYIVRPYA